MSRLQGTEESQMRRKLVILKHSSALPALLFDSEIICGVTTLGCQFGVHQVEVTVLCAKQYAMHYLDFTPSDDGHREVEADLGSCCLLRSASRGKWRLRWITVVSNVCFVFKDCSLLLMFLVTCLGHSKLGLFLSWQMKKKSLYAIYQPSAPPIPSLFFLPTLPFFT